MIEVATDIERWELVEPFVTARDSYTHVPVLVVRLTGPGGQRGWAEAAGVDYDGETPASMAAQIEVVRGALHDRLTGPELLQQIPIAWGQINYWWNRFSKTRQHLIEYK